MPYRTGIESIYHLEFYRKKRDWALTRDRTQLTSGAIPKVSSSGAIPKRPSSKIIKNSVKDACHVKHKQPCPEFHQSDLNVLNKTFVISASSDSSTSDYDSLDSLWINKLSSQIAKCAATSSKEDVNIQASREAGRETKTMSFGSRMRLASTHVNEASIINAKDDIGMDNAYGWTSDFVPRSTVAPNLFKWDQTTSPPQKEATGRRYINMSGKEPVKQNRPLDNVDFMKGIKLVPQFSPSDHWSTSTVEGISRQSVSLMSTDDLVLKASSLARALHTLCKETKQRATESSYAGNTSNPEIYRLSSKLARYSELLARIVNPGAQDQFTQGGKSLITNKEIVLAGSHKQNEPEHFLNRYAMSETALHVGRGRGRSRSREEDPFINIGWERPSPFL